MSTRGAVRTRMPQTATRHRSEWDARPMRRAPLELRCQLLEGRMTSRDRDHARRLALDLAANATAGVGCMTTWFNHHSALESMRAAVPVQDFDLLGIDGKFLGLLLHGHVPRTSADLVLPLLLDRAGPLRIALIGSTDAVLEGVAARVEADGRHTVVIKRNGYSHLPPPEALRSLLLEACVQLVILGLGSPMQDQYAIALRSPTMVIVTCGGWLDQFAHGTYYPVWTYALRLNWLVRLIKEPRRLWRRYTIGAVRALFSRRDLTVYIQQQGARPYKTMLAVTSGVVAADPDTRRRAC